MVLSLGIFGGYFSDRIVLSSHPLNEQEPLSIKISNAWFSRLLTLFWMAPKDYTALNTQTIRLFKERLIRILGPQRLQRICQRMGVDLDGKAKKGEAFYSRDIAKILIGVKDVRVNDIQDLINSVKKGDSWTFWIPSTMKTVLVGIHHFSQLTNDQFTAIFHRLSEPFQPTLQCPRIEKAIKGNHRDRLANVFFDPFTIDRERLQLCETNSRLEKKGFYEKIAKRISKKEMEVGMLIPAYSQPNQKTSFYRVAAKLITAKGLQSYTLLPATSDMHLVPLRVFRGSDWHASGIDALGDLITGTEKELGRTAYESGMVYEKYHQRKFGCIPVELGHSKGGTIVQWRTAAPFTAQDLYMYNAPGVPLSVVQKFKENVRQARYPTILNIQETKYDHLQRLGDYNIGYGATENVQINYEKYAILESATKFHPHCFCFANEISRFSVNNRYKQEVLNRRFDHTRRPLNEYLRAVVAGNIIYPLLIVIKTLSRSIFGARAEQLKGLSVEKLSATDYHIEHITEQQALSLSTR